MSSPKLSVGIVEAALLQSGGTSEHRQGTENIQFCLHSQSNTITGPVYTISWKCIFLCRLFIVALVIVNVVVCYTFHLLLCLVLCLNTRNSNLPAQVKT